MFAYSRLSSLNGNKMFEGPPLISYASTLGRPLKKLVEMGPRLMTLSFSLFIWGRAWLNLPPMFELLHTDAGSQARRGRLTTSRGTIETPVFMPVGTQGSVKALDPRELLEMGTQVTLGNTYHLYIRPGLEIINAAGGLHKVINWPYPILTDSG